MLQTISCCRCCRLKQFACFLFHLFILIVVVVFCVVCYFYPLHVNKKQREKNRMPCMYNDNYANTHSQQNKIVAHSRYSFVNRKCKFLRFFFSMYTETDIIYTFLLRHSRWLSFITIIVLWLTVCGLGEKILSALKWVFNWSAWKLRRNHEKKIGIYNWAENCPKNARSTVWLPWKCGANVAVATAAALSEHLQR